MFSLYLPNQLELESPKALLRTSVWYANGYELLNNESRISEVRQRGFTHAIVLDSTSPAALKRLAQQGLAPVINVGWDYTHVRKRRAMCYSNGTQERCRKYSPLVNATYYEGRVAHVRFA